MMRRHARHTRKQATRAQLLAQNMKRRAPAPAVPDAPIETPEPSGTGFVGYHVETYGLETAPWHRLIGPDGEKVGRSVRDEAEAWAQIPGSDR